MKTAWPTGIWWLSTDGTVGTDVDSLVGAVRYRGVSPSFRGLHYHLFVRIFGEFRVDVTMVLINRALKMMQVMENIRRGIDERTLPKGYRQTTTAFAACFVHHAALLSSSGRRLDSGEAFDGGRSRTELIGCCLLRAHCCTCRQGRETTLWRWRWRRYSSFIKVGLIKRSLLLGFNHLHHAPSVRHDTTALSFHHEIPANHITCFASRLALSSIIF